MFKSNIGGRIELKFKDVDVPVRPDCHVHPSLAGVFLHFCIEATKCREDIHHALEVSLLVRLEFIRAVGKECLQADHKSLDILISETQYKLANLKSGFCFLDIGIVRNKKLHETLFHLFVRIPQFV